MIIYIDARLLDKYHNTGISRYTEFIIEYYAKKYGDNNITLISNDRDLEYKQYKIKYTPYRPFNMLHFLRYWRWIKSLNPDLLHIPFYSGLYNKAENTKVIVTVHDLMYRLVDDFFGNNKILNRLKILYFDYIVRKTLQNSNSVISVSETTQMDLYEMFSVKSVKIPEYSSIQVDEDKSILEYLKLSPKSYFLYCGNNRPHKNLPQIINFFNSNPELPPLVLTGKGHITGNNVISAGIVSEKALKSLYISSKAFIFPSKYEGFGLPILEALSCQTLVIASDIPAFREFRSVNIRYFKIGDDSSLCDAVNSVLQSDFINEPTFFDDYSPKKIYELLDSITL